VYARLVLRLLADIRPYPYELEEAIVNPRFREVREWLSDSLDIRDSIGRYGSTNDKLKVSFQVGTYAQNLVYDGLSQTAKIKQVGTHFTSRDEEALFEKGKTDLELVTWHTMRNKIRDQAHPRDWVILRIYRGGAPVFAVQRNHLLRKTLLYPEGAKQRSSLAKRVSHDVGPADPIELVPGFADGGYHGIVTQPPNSTVLLAMENSVTLDLDEEDYFLVASKRLFNTGNANVRGLITQGRVASARLLQEATRYRLASRYVIRDLNAELKRIPRYREIAGLLSQIREVDSAHAFLSHQ